MVDRDQDTASQGPPIQGFPTALPDTVAAMRYPLLVLVALFVTAGQLSAQNAEVVWWEGEAASTHTFTNTAFPVAWFGDKANGLSAGNWLNTGGKRVGEPVRAEWQVTLPHAGRWYFHGRMFWKHGPFRWRFDDGSWQTCGHDRGLLDSYELATHIVANWVSLGQVDLAAGPHRFQIELLAAAGEDAVACFDCFVLTTAPFTPRGKLKPGEAYGLATPGWWAFEPEPDLFRADAALSLRTLNEAVAGERGPITRHNAEFRTGAGKPIRFWGVNAGPALLEQDEAAIDYFAGRMAKLGVNLVRLHGSLVDRSGADPTAISLVRLNKLQYTVQALKKQGIYSELSTFFPLWMQMIPSDGLVGSAAAKSKNPFGRLFFEPRMQDLYRAWVRTILTTTDPRTGKSLAEEPAVALFEIINEDSLLFWTFTAENVGAPAWTLIEQQFAQWAEKQYGSLAQAATAWQGERLPDDAAECLGLYDPWHLTADALSKSGPGKQARAKAQARFYTETQHDFYAHMRDYLRNEIKYRGCVVASNWITADPGSLGALERWSYTATDVLDRHGYFGGAHSGDGADYSLRTGHTYADRCALKFPEELSIKVNQWTDFPQLISEIAWNRPNRFVADSAMVLSAYASLQDVDGLCLFATHSGQWDSSGGSKWALMMPSQAGQFPAAALSYRLGLIQTGKPVIRQRLTEKAMWELEGTGLGEGASSDFRLAGKPDANVGAHAAACDPLAFFVGQIEHTLDPAVTPINIDLAPFIDRTKQIVQSSTKELRWDWGLGLLTINAPASQGVSGFLRQAGPITLATLSIQSDLDYGSVWAVALDGVPLAQSKRILIQAFSEERFYGFTAEKGVITDLGQAPINVRDIFATITIPGKFQATALDAHGYPAEDTAVRFEKAQTIVTLPHNRLYTLLTR